MPQDQPDETNPQQPIPPQTPGQPPQPPSPAPAGRKRRRWPWVVLILFLLLVGLVALAPTIASMGVVRSIVVGKVNNNLNGQVQIADWSLGWFSPISVSGIKVFDDQRRLILEVPRIKLDMSVLDAARGNYALGNDSQIDVSFLAEVDQDGHTNFERLVKSAAKKGGGGTGEGTVPQPAKLPNVSGKITVNFRGTVAGAGVAVPVNVDPSTVVFDIPDINKPINETLKLVYRIGDASAQPSAIDASGTIAAIQGGQVQIDKLVAAQKVLLKNVNLAAAEPFLKKPLGADVKLGGIADGGLDLNAQGLSGISASGQIGIANLLFAGGPLKGGDQYQAQKISIPINITSVPGDNGTNVKVEQLGVQLPQANVAITGQLSRESLQNLANGKAPGSEGKLAIEAEVTDLPALANQLRHTLQLEQGVAITGGAVHEDASLTIAKDRVILSQKLNASAQGTRNGSPIQLQPITVSADATAIPAGNRLPDVSDVKLAVNSAFAKVQGGGASLAKLDITGNFDLGKLRRELGQFADLGKLQLQGGGDFKLGTNGDLTSDSAPIATNAVVNLNNVKLSGFGSQPIDQDRLVINLSGNILREAGAPAGVDKGYLAVTSGDPSAPLLDLAANANLDLRDKNKLKAPWFELAKCTIADLARIQQQYGGLIPSLAQQKLQIESGALYATAAGSYDGTTLKLAKPAAISLPNLTLTKEGRRLLNKEVLRASLNGSFSLPADGIAADLSDLSVTTDSKLVSLSKSGDSPLSFALTHVGQNVALRGNWQISLGADLKRLGDLAQNFGGKVAVQPDQPQVQSGQFNGTVVLAKADKPETSVEFKGQITGLTISANNKNTLDNEQVTIAFKGVAADDIKGTAPLTASGKIGSSFVNTNLSDVKVSLAGGTWDTLQSADIDAQIPDLPKLYALLQALAPPASGAAPATAPQGQIDPRSLLAPTALLVLQQDEAPVPRSRRRAPAAAAEAAGAPLPPLQLTSGGATVKLNVSRDGASKITTLNIPDCRISKLALRRGKQEYRFDQNTPIRLKVAATVQAADDPSGKSTLVQQVQSLKVNDLSGDLRVARLSMTTPIVATNLGATPNVQGGVKVEGSLSGDQGLAPLLAVMQGMTLPYAGDYVATQNVKTQGNTLSLDGTVTASKFQALQDGKPVFNEDRVDLIDQVDLDLSAKSATIKTVSLNMVSSQALGLKLTGGLQDWSARRQLNNIRMDLSYDLAKLWPIIYPMLVTPGQEDPYKDVKAAGKYTKAFAVSGAYPATDSAGKPLEWRQSLQSVSAAGELTVDQLDAMGLSVQQWDIPIALSRGHGAIIYAGKPKEQRLPKAAQCNGGTLDIAGIDVDLTQQDPRISIGRNQKLLQHVTINPLLGDSLGKYINPVFTNSQRAKGLLDVTVSYCQGVALGQKLKTPESGKAKIIFSITDMDIANPVGSLMLGKVTSAIPGIGGIDQNQADTFQGQVKDGVVTLENGVTTTDVTFQLVDQGRPADATGARQPPKPTVMPLSFKGDIRLSDLKQNLQVKVPPQLIAKFVPTDQSLGNNLLKIFPDGIPIALKGTTLKPQPDVGDIGRAFIEGQVKTGGEGLLQGILGGDQGNKKENRKRQR